MINTTAFHQSIHQSSHNDEYLTPPEAVRIVLPYVRNKRIWCPFDEAGSAFVQVFEEALPSCTAPCRMDRTSSRMFQTNRLIALSAIRRIPSVIRFLCGFLNCRSPS